MVFEEKPKPEVWAQLWLPDPVGAWVHRVFTPHPPQGVVLRGGPAEGAPPVLRVRPGSGAHSPLRWVGGKQKLARQIAEALLSDLRVARVYCEPFLGGASVAIEAARAVYVPRLVLADVNAELVNFWRTLAGEPEAFAAAWAVEIQAFDEAPVRAYELAVGAIGQGTDAERAARFFFLNRLSNAGLWRVNTEGLYNVPLRRDLPSGAALQKAGEGAIAIGRAFVGTSWHAQGFTETLAEAREGWLVYADPPYLPVAMSGIRYAAEGFDDAQQVALEKACKGAVERGARVWVSQSDTPRTREIWAGWRMRSLVVARQLGRSHEAPEVLICA